MKIASVSIAVMVCAAMLVAHPGFAADEAQDRKAVQEVFEKYLRSVKGADLAIASDIWAHRPDVLVVTPFGRFQGWEQVRAELYVNFLQKSFVERELRPSNVAIGAAGDSAWLVFDWAFTGKLPDGQTITSKGWESHVYQRTPQGWRIVQLHYSVPPPPPPRP